MNVPLKGVFYFTERLQQVSEWIKRPEFILSLKLDSNMIHFDRIVITEYWLEYARYSQGVLKWATGLKEWISDELKELNWNELSINWTIKLDTNMIHFDRIVCNHY